MLIARHLFSLFSYEGFRRFVVPGLMNLQRSPPDKPLEDLGSEMKRRCFEPRALVETYHIRLKCAHRRFAMLDSIVALPDYPDGRLQMQETW